MNEILKHANVTKSVLIGMLVLNLFCPGFLLISFLHTEMLEKFDSIKLTLLSTSISSPFLLITILLSLLRKSVHHNNKTEADRFLMLFTSCVKNTFRWVMLTLVVLIYWYFWPFISIATITNIYILGSILFFATSLVITFIEAVAKFYNTSDTTDVAKTS